MTSLNALEPMEGRGSKIGYWGFGDGVGVGEKEFVASAITRIPYITHWVSLCEWISEASC